MVAAYIQFEAFNDEAIKYFINGFDTLRHRALRKYPDLDLFMLRTNVESTSVMQEPNNKIVADQEKDDVTF